jgi:uncharacterized membrane protein YdcZ (DUF606 family)
MTNMALSITVGVGLAFLQSTLSVMALRWALSRRSFYWVWGGGMLARFVIFAITAFVVHRNTTLNLAATLISLALATTLFLTLEAALFGKK